jgi:hypothetical protein
MKRVNLSTLTGDVRSLGRPSDMETESKISRMVTLLTSESYEKFPIDHE